jgi:hypothetical protein
METLKSGIYTHTEDWRATVVCNKFDKYNLEGWGAEYVISEGDLVLRFFPSTPR